MVKLDAFDIHLDQPNGCYYAGQLITGKLLISSTYTLQINELYVTLKGESRTNWVEKVSDNIYDSLEPYLNERKILAKEPLFLAPGTQTIPFQFRIPAHVPSSYEGDYGYVRYVLIGKIEISNTTNEYGFLKNKEILVDRIITVFASVELGQLTPVNDCGLSKEDILEIVGCCGSGGQISAILSIPKTAFLVGQMIPIRVDLENMTRRRQAAASITFVQDVHFRSISLFQSARDQKTLSRVIDSVRMDSPEQGKALVRDIGIRIPIDLSPTSIGNTLITIRYKIRLELGRQCDIVVPIGVASKA